MADVWWWRFFVVMGIATLLAACGSGSPAGGEPDAGNDGGIDAPMDSDGRVDDVAAPSCTSLPATCGASGDDSCCSSPSVVGGTYHRSYDLAGDTHSGSVNFPAKVSAFRLDKYEITVGRFRAFVAAGMGTRNSPPVDGAGAHAGIAGSGWNAAWNNSLATDTAALTALLQCSATLQTWTSTPGTDENRPMNCITWFEAMAFCAWDGGYLPTEAEWNYAATGGVQQRAYPWSSAGSQLAFDAQHASYKDGADCVGDGQAGCAVTDLVKVGGKPAGDGRWGQSDLGGNVMEWALDWLEVYRTPCEDCATVAGFDTRAIRGGYFDLFALAMRTGVRGGVPPVVRGVGFGARCARAAL
jgi:formylglycine-generating enzyme required for sulfatase activity